MKRKSILFIVSIVLVLAFAFAFVACNEDDSSGNDLPKIRLKEDMTIAEVREALKDVKNFKLVYSENGEETSTHYFDESGQVYIFTEDGDTFYGAYFIEGNKLYDLWREFENSVEVDKEYTWENATDEDINDIKQSVAENLESYLDEIEEDVEDGDGTYTIKNNVITYIGTEGGYTQKFVLSDFNKTALPKEEFFPNYKDLAVEYVDEDDNSDISDNNDLPNINLTDGMTLDDVKAIFTDVTNYKMIYDNIHNDLTQYKAILHMCETGYTCIDYDEESESSRAACFYEGNKYYDLNISDGNYIQVEVLELERSIKEFCETYGRETLEEFMTDVENSRATMRIEDGKIIFTRNFSGGGIGVYTLYDFNDTTLSLDDFPNYEDFEIGTSFGFDIH